MAWYRRSSRFIFDAFRRYNSRTAVPRNPFQASLSLNTSSLRSNSSASRISQFSQPVFRSSILQNVVKNHVERIKAEQLQTVVRNWARRERKKISLSIVFLGCGFVITVFFGHRETVPYTKRSHSVLFSSSFDIGLGESVVWYTKTKYKEKILPPLHPESVRVQKIANEIIEVVKSQNAGSEGFKWEVFVVDDPKTVNAFCAPGGKVVIFTGLLNRFREDPEIATIIGHEVGHAVARHTAELFDIFMWLAILWLIFTQFLEPDVALITLFLILPYSQRMETEADYIGLLLIACAGYDPRVAPKVYEKLGKIGGSWRLNDYLATHPSGKTRAKLLSEVKVVEEALVLYKDVQAKDM